MWGAFSVLEVHLFVWGGGGLVVRSQKRRDDINHRINIYGVGGRNTMRF